jgi:four helix bundle protein
MEEERGKTHPTTYGRLTVYQRSYQAALVVHRSTRGASEREADLVRQLRRATRSIPANIAEGVNRSNSEAETKRFLGLAWRSCDEVRVWVAFCRDLELLGAAEAGQWEQEYAEIGAMLYRLWQHWRHQP